MKQCQACNDIGYSEVGFGQQVSQSQHTASLDDSSGVFAHLLTQNNEELAATVDPFDAVLFAVAFSTTGMPSANQHPANISDAGSLIWNRLLTSSKYLEAVHGKTSLQAWAICTKMFLDMCHRKGVTPFRSKTKKAITLQALTTEYARYRSLCSSLEQQVCKTLGFDNLVESIDRGVWKFSNVEYRDKRFVIVLQTRWLAVSDNVKKLMQAFKREQFEKVPDIPGISRVISGNASVRVRIQKFPYITLQMRLQFSKDKLLAFNIGNSNARTMLDEFDYVARYWVRARKFVTVNVARKQPML